MAKKKVVKKEERKESKKTSDRKIFAFLATFLSILGFIIALIAKKEDRYVMFYAKQSLVIFIMAIVGSIISTLVMWIPFFGEVISYAINLIVLVLWIFSWAYALSDKEKEVPIVGLYAKKLNF